MSKSKLVWLVRLNVQLRQQRANRHVKIEKPLARQLSLLKAERKAAEQAAKEAEAEAKAKEAAEPAN